MSPCSTSHTARPSRILVPSRRSRSGSPSASRMAARGPSRCSRGRSRTRTATRSARPVWTTSSRSPWIWALMGPTQKAARELASARRWARRSGLRWARRSGLRWARRSGLLWTLLSALRWALMSALRWALLSGLPWALLSSQSPVARSRGTRLRRRTACTASTTRSSPRTRSPRHNTSNPPTACRRTGPTARRNPRRDPPRPRTGMSPEPGPPWTGPPWRGPRCLGRWCLALLASASPCPTACTRTTSRHWPRKNSLVCNTSARPKRTHRTACVAARTRSRTCRPACTANSAHPAPRTNIRPDNTLALSNQHLRTSPTHWCNPPA
mmetsp:Transcript_4246/g.12764  ORF Transcript_4246/g.12764 Transcript_4246/m.12764 type:complete len:325 (-) Transcript_4246:536-1510(-)